MSAVFGFFPFTVFVQLASTVFHGWHRVTQSVT